jgi:acyl-CoA thioester hydrolase
MTHEPAVKGLWMKIHPISEGAHHHQIRVYYEDTDAGGVVYHATYLRLAERARTEALRDLGVPHAELVSQHGVMFMVRRIKVDYFEPARLDDSLSVTTRPLVVGAASVELRQEITRVDLPGRVLASLDIRLACVRLADQRAVRIPSRWREALQGMAVERDSAP